MSSYNNYITKDEYDCLVKTLYNRNGVLDNFDCLELEQYLVNRGKKLDCVGKYNKYALFLAMNYMKRCHAEFIDQLIQTGRFDKPAICYQLAIDYLESDKKNWIRDLFCL